MEVAEFEEKEYETFFNKELPTDIVWSPGQVAEHKLAFDFMAFVDGPFPFFGSRPFRWQPRRGVRLDRRYWRRFFQAADDDLPPFRVNFFAQYKRPWLIEGHRAAEWSHWGHPYFRYQLVAPQLNALVRLEHALGDRALVVYASPAFHTKRELWAAVRKRRLIDRSNFALPSALNGHHAYTYDQAGTSGWACSDGMETSGPKFNEMILHAWNAARPRPLSKLVREAGNAITETMQDVGDLDGQFQEVSAYLSGDDTDPLINALAQISALNFIFGTALSCLGGALIKEGE